MSNGTNFEVLTTAKLAWSKVEGYKTPIILASLFCVAIQLVTAFIAAIFYRLLGKFSADLLENLINGIVLTPAYVGLMYMGLQRVRGMPVLASQVLYAYRWNLLIQIWIASLIIFGVTFIYAMIAGMLSVIPVAGLIIALAIVAVGIYIYTRISLTLYLIVDKDQNAIEALKQSYRMTKTYVWKLMLAYSFLWLVIIVGFMLFLVGLVWAIPFAYIFGALIYLSIESGTDQ